MGEYIYFVVGGKKFFFPKNRLVAISIYVKNILEDCPKTIEICLDELDITSQDIENLITFLDTLVIPEREDWLALLRLLDYLDFTKPYISSIHDRIVKILIKDKELIFGNLTFKGLIRFLSDERFQHEWKKSNLN